MSTPARGSHDETMTAMKTVSAVVGTRVLA
jgi:hypothetical protein